jgi:hypothetical protein
MTSDFLQTRTPLTCSGCIHEFTVRGEKRCDLGELHGVRCTKYRITAKGEK